MSDLTWCAYHPTNQPIYVGSLEEYEHLLKNGWFESPACVGNVLESKKESKTTPRETKKDESK
jgi:hypothetical protein